MLLNNGHLSKFLPQNNLKTNPLQDITRLKSPCLCKSIQHNVTLKNAGVKTPPLKVSSTFTNTLEFGVHNYRDLKKKPTMVRDRSRYKQQRKVNAKNIKVRFGVKPIKNTDFESYTYNGEIGAKTEYRKPSLHSINNLVKKNRTNTSPCKKDRCRGSYDASKFFDCICNNRANEKRLTKEQKKTKGKNKTTCLCYATGDFKDNVEDIRIKNAKEVKDINMVEHLTNILGENNTSVDMCNEGICTALKQTKKNLDYKNNQRKRNFKPPKCLDLKSEIVNNSLPNKGNFKDKIICLSKTYSHRLSLNHKNLDKRIFNQDTRYKTSCGCKLINKRKIRVLKNTKIPTIKECADETCDMRKKIYLVKPKVSRKVTTNEESATGETEYRNTKKQLKHYCHCFKAKFIKNNSKDKNHKQIEYRPKSYYGDIKEEVVLKSSLESKQDQTGEPFFDIKVNPIDMRTLNPDEVKEKVMALGKFQKITTCTCPSHNMKSANFLMKTACPVGVCKKAFKNKKTNFTCSCTSGKSKMCSDTTCDVGGKIADLSPWPTKRTRPIFEMKLDSNNMNVINTKEIRNKMQDIEQMAKGELCPSGTCHETLKYNGRYICKCIYKKRLAEIEECTDDTCHQGKLINMINNTNNNKPVLNNSIRHSLEIDNESQNIENNDLKAHSQQCRCKAVEKLWVKSKTNIKSRISCICSRILGKPENLVKRQTSSKKAKQSPKTLNNHAANESNHDYNIKANILKKKQALAVNCLCKDSAKIKNDNISLNITEISSDTNPKTKARQRTYKSSYLDNSVKEKRDVDRHIEKEPILQKTETINKVNRTILCHRSNENGHSCYCCVCDVKSDCKCINTHRKLKCTDILWRSCSHLFRRSGIRKQKYQSKRLVSKKDKEKINKSEHAYIENCVCCSCGKQSNQCTCERSPKISKCKNILCRSLSNLLRRNNQPVTYSRNDTTSKAKHIHKRKSLSIPIEKYLYDAKTHHPKHNNAKKNKIVIPTSLTIGKNDNKNVDDINDNKIIYNPHKDKVLSMTDKNRTEDLQRNKVYIKSKENRVKYKEEKVCMCSHTCECALSKHKDQSKRDNAKKKDKLNKRQRLKEKRRGQSLKNKHSKKKSLKKKKVWLADEKKLQKDVIKRDKVQSKKRVKKLHLEKKQLEAISKGQEEIDETSCLADFFLGLLKLGLCIIKGFGFVLFKLITDFKGSMRFAEQRLKDPAGTYERIKKAFLEYWGFKKLQMLKSVAGSEKMTILSDTLQNTGIFQAFADKGKTKKEKRLIEQNNRIRRKRIIKRDKEALHGCRHMLLHTLRKTPCLWFYHIFPQFYPQCLSCLACWHNLSDILLFLLAFIVWTPCIVCFEGFRALSCCLLCTG